METRKAKSRRVVEGFFVKYIAEGRGLDVGCGDDPLTSSCDKLDLVYGQDAEKAIGYISNETYNWVYSSHMLEDVNDPHLMIKEWWRILKDGGYLILYVPHRDLFEHRRTLPSCGNANHKWFFLIDRDEPPCTLGIIPLIRKSLTNYDIEYVKRCDAGYSCKFVNNENVPGGIQPIAIGEFSIEAVIRKGYYPTFIDHLN